MPPVVQGLLQLQKNMVQLSNGAHMAVARSLSAPFMDAASLLRSAYKSKGLKFTPYGKKSRPVEVKVHVAEMRLDVPIGHLSEHGTGVYIKGGELSKPVAAHGQKPYVAKVRASGGKRTMLAGSDKTSDRMYKGRPVIGRKAVMQGIKPTPVFGPVLVDWMPTVPGRTGQILMGDWTRDYSVTR